MVNAQYYYKKYVIKMMTQENGVLYTALLNGKAD